MVIEKIEEIKLYWIHKRKTWKINMAALICYAIGSLFFLIGTLIAIYKAVVE